jgi:uncharacterized protein (TIGR03086 family)
MRENEVFVLADQALNRVVQRIRDEQWDMLVPDDFVRNPSESVPSVREVLNYHAYDDAWVPDMLAGHTMAEVGVDAWKGDLLGDLPKPRFQAIVERACEAAAALTDLDRTVHLSFGDYPAREYFWQTNGFRTLRAADFARILGQHVDLEPELVQAVYDELSPHMDEWRAIGVFPAPLPIADDAPLLDRLLCMTGRQPVTGALSSGPR